MDGTTVAQAAPLILLVEDEPSDEKRTVSSEHARIKAWRRRAEELRTTADNFVVPSAQEALRRAAANYDLTADAAEARLTDKPKAPGRTLTEPPNKPPRQSPLAVNPAVALQHDPRACRNWRQFFGATLALTTSQIDWRLCAVPPPSLSTD